MHHELCFLRAAHNRQSGRATFPATATLYFWVTKNLDLRMETTSPYEEHTSHPSFL